MSEEDIFKKVLVSTIERYAKQVMNYEIEIANLSAQIISLSEAQNTKTTTNKKQNS